MEAARRFESMCIPDSFPFLSLANSAERQAKAPSTLVSLESQAMVFQEPPSNPGRIQVFSAKVGILPSFRGVLLYLLNQLRDPRGCDAIRLHRMTSQTGAISGNKSIANAW